MSGRLADFGFQSTAADVVAGVDLSGRRAVVTGAGSGLGMETARALVSAGAEVTLAVRRPDTLAAFAEELCTVDGPGSAAVATLDLADLASVRSFTEAWTGPLHLLVNNAGIMALPRMERDAHGRELQFATNYLGHFALTLGLKEALVRAQGARVVSLSSAAHMQSPVVFDDLDFRFRRYDPWLAYGQSKTADVLLAVGVTRRWAGEGVVANAVHPGIIATNLQKHMDGWQTDDLPMKSIPQGAATSVLVGTAPELDGVGGRYFQDCQEAPVVAQRPRDFSPAVAPYAVDAENAERLWETGLRLLG